MVMVLSLVASVASASEWGLLVLNTQWGSSSLMAGIDKPYTSQEERQDRIQNLGPRLFKGYVDGNVQAAKPRTFLIYVWGSSVAPTSVISVAGKGGQVRISSNFEDVTGKVPSPVFSKENDLGAPTKVYRVKADGIGVESRFDMNQLVGATILICSEDHMSVYPADGKAEAKQGLWVMPAQLAALKAYGAPGSIAPFVSSE